MIAALLPTVSWTLLLACVAVGALVYVAIAGGHRYRKVLSDADTLEQLGRDLDAMRYDPAPFVRVLPHVYDHEAHGDFE